MANYNFKVRAGCSVTLGAPDANDPSATVYVGGQQVSLSDAQVEGHAHKLEPFDSAATTKLNSIAGRVHVGTANQF
jgi:hypothetical protein